ncbi:MAG: 3'-5' exoribonuclease YhaM family protein [Dissulfurimicrobium sp.]|uniref:3'-5' exoribonuclease YhaM family protein n=1 Tax=Dissulfurimicrobium sp. TaxID=2022436 RepID=UPI0040498CA2
MEKGKFITEIRTNDLVEGVFLVKSKHLYSSKNGSPYIALTIMDKTGEIEGRIWENAQAVNNTFKERDFVFIKGDAVSWQGVTQIKISDIKILNDDEVDPALFMPVCPVNTEELWHELQKYIKKINCLPFKRLLTEIFKNNEIRDGFLKAPAAKRMHHAYVGGLLEHSVSVARLANTISGLYPQLDRDLLITAAILHDIGKSKEFSFERPPIEYSDKGRLIGHLVLGVAIIDDVASSLGLDKDANELVALKHLVLSHHGQREFGAPVLPMMEEAVALHLIDDLDAKLNYLNGLKSGIGGNGYGWTEYQRPLERYFYLKGQDDMGHIDSKEEDMGQREENKSSPKQMSLLPAENQE